MIRHYLLPATAALLLLFRAAAAQHVEPLPPAELLAGFPPASESWTLSKSNARVLLTDRISVVAVRQYTSATEGNQVEYKVTDTGGHPEAIREFEGASEPASGERKPAVEEKSIDGSPARIIRTEQGITLESLVARRFLVEVKFLHFEPEDPAAWVQSLRTNWLLSQARPAAAGIPKEVDIVFVDELNPKRSRTYTATTHDAAAHQILLQNKEYQTQPEER